MSLDLTLFQVAIQFVATTSRSELLGRYPLDGGRAPSLSDWPGEAREGLNFSVK